MRLTGTRSYFFPLIIFASVTASGLAGCSLLGEKAAPPEGENPSFVYAGARMQRGGGQVTAVTLRKVDGKREKVSLRWTGGFDLLNRNSTFYREMVPPGRYRIDVIHFDSGGKTYIQEVRDHFRDFEVKPEGIQFIGKILVERNGSDFRYQMGGAEVNRKAIFGNVREHLGGTAWAPLLEKHR